MPLETISIVVPHWRRLAVLAIGFFAVAPCGAVAATQSASVPALTAAPALDARTPASTWPADPSLELPWDVVHTSNAGEKTSVHVASDGRFLYVRFDAAQTGPVAATQHSNDTITGGSNGTNGSLSWSADDAVWVDLWPTGVTGFEYQFEANPNGSHNESSSENAAFAPQWESHGAIHDGGYTVTMAIPIAVLHGAQSGTWRAQFVRYTRATGAQAVWSFDAGQTRADDPSRAARSPSRSRTKLRWRSRGLPSMGSVP